jgi:3-hydroxyacyl-[acyl-carrier-protein] dehydratase
LNSLNALVKRDSPMSAEVLADESRRLISLLPQQHPMRLVDRITAIVRGVQIRGVKNVSITEHFFVGHLPGRPVMPGVLIMEALAQVCQVLFLTSDSARPPRETPYLLAIDEGRFRRPVLPGDQLILSARFIRALKGIHIFEALAEVDARPAAAARMMIGAKE